MPVQEAERLQALEELGILYSAADPDFDDLALLAAQVCGTPIAAVSFVDATSQWFKSHVGLAMCSTRREAAFCAHTILDPGRHLVVPDTTCDVRFSASPLVTGEPRVRFYAGVPLVTSGGFAIGTLCVKDVVAREITPMQLASLQGLARQVMRLVEARRIETELSELKTALGHHAIVVTADLSGKVASVTGQHAGIFEREPGTESAESATHPASVLFAAAWPSITAGSVWRGEVAVDVSHDRQGWIHATVVPIRDGGGRIRQYIALGTDVTLTHRIKEAAQRQSAKLQALFDLMPAFIWFKDTENRILRANRWAAEATGKSVAEIEGRHTREIYPRDADRFFADDLEVIRSGTAKLGIVAPLHDQTGQERWTSTDKVPYRDHTGNVVGIVVMARDITQKRRDEEMLRLLGSAVHFATDSVMITDAQSSSPGPRIIFVNPAFTALTGYSAEEAIGRSPRILQGDRTDRAELARIAAAVREGNPIRGETVNYHRNGHELDLDWQLAPIRASDGAITHFVAVFRDISERKAAERELTLAREAAIESSRLKSRFLANMSHELRTPLNGINGLCSMLLEQGLPAAAEHAIKLILQSGETLLENIQTILTHSSLEAAKVTLDRKPFSLVEVVLNAIRIATPRATLRNLSLDYRIDLRAPAQLLGDPFRLQQALVNFVANAVKFTDQGRVYVRVRAFPLADGLCELRFAIADTGIGIEEEKLAQLFQPFSQVDDSSTRRFEGSGLGLAIAKSIIELMQGSVHCVSRPGVGSLFRFRVRVPVELPALPLATVTTTAGLEGQRVAIDEPDSLRRRELHRLVVAWGMHSVANSASPTSIIRRYQTGAEAHGTLPTVWLCRTHQPPAHSQDSDTILYEPFAPAELAKALAAALGASTRAPFIGGDRAQPQKMAARLPLRVLAADDNRANRESLRLICRHLGYVTDFVENGVQALAALDAKKYDLVLLDVQMPVLDGLATAEEICRRQPNPALRPRLVAVTANAQPADRDRCLRAGMDDYLSKPVLPKSLATCLDRLFGSADLRASHPASDGDDKPTVPAPQLLDRAHLQAITEDLPHDEAVRLVRSLYAAVEADFAAMRPRIEIASTNRDHATLASLVHGLKGSVLSVGWTALAGRCAAVSAALRQGSFDGWQGLPVGLQALFVESAAALERMYPATPSAR